MEKHRKSKSQSVTDRTKRDRKSPENLKKEPEYKRLKVIMDNDPKVRDRLLEKFKDGQE